MKPTIKGYTFLETLVGLSLITLLGGLLLGVLHTSRQYTAQSVQRLKELQQAQQTLNLLEDLCLRTQVPSWVSSQSVVKVDGSGLSIRYLEGKEQLIWKVERTMDTLRVHSPELEWESHLLKETVFSPWQKEERVIGLKAEFQWGGKAFTFHWPWGRLPL